MKKMSEGKRKATKTKAGVCNCQCKCGCGTGDATVRSSNFDQDWAANSSTTQPSEK